MNDDDLKLRIVGIENDGDIGGARRLRLRTTRGAIALIVHPAGETERVALCVSGALGGFDGPAELYPRLGATLPQSGIAVVRLDYRIPNEFGECVLDTLAGLSFLGAMKCRRAALVGHSLGGAVAINAGTLSPLVSTVVAISSQLFGAHVVEALAPRPLLLVHGTADSILSHASSEQIYQRAHEPRTLKLFPGADHRFTDNGDGLLAAVGEWIEERLG